MVPKVRPCEGPLRVLLIEDEALPRMALAEELRAGETAVIEAHNAEEAWSYLQAGGEADLVFSDVRLPGSMNGLELAQRIMRHYPGLAVILTSGSLQPAAAEWPGGFIAKPYPMHEALRLIHTALAERRAAR